MTARQGYQRHDRSKATSGAVQRVKRRATAVGTTIVLAIIFVWLLFPFLWVISCSLRPLSKMFRYPPEWLPSPITFDNFQWVFARETFWMTLRNSLILSIGAALIVLVVCSLPAFSLARLKYPGKRGIMLFIMATQMLPLVLLLIPLFILMSRLRLINNYASMLLVYVNHSIPFSVLMLRSYFVNFPMELEEAAMVDGCTRMQAFRHITLPLSLPGLVAVALFVFIVVWNDIFYALVLTNNIHVRPVSVQLYMLATTDFAATNWGGILAESVLITLPVVLIFTFLQRYLIQGMTAGAVK